MEVLTSRKNPYIQHLRELAKDACSRRAAGEFICDSPKLLEEALLCGAELTSVLWRKGKQENGGRNYCADSGDSSAICGAALPDDLRFAEGVREYMAEEELFAYASPMVNSPGPVFTVRIKEPDTDTPIGNAIVLENVQDPGNIGTVIRTANAFGIGAVILTGECADLYSPKTVRSTMGALFRQRVIRTDNEHLLPLLKKHGLPLYGAVLSDRAKSILAADLSGGCAVAVGNEGRGLSGELRQLCEGELIIPMEPGTESLNAAVAAAVIMWEMRGRT